MEHSSPWSLLISATLLGGKKTSCGWAGWFSGVSGLDDLSLAEFPVWMISPSMSLV